jgi:IS30 family transposase
MWTPILLTLTHPGKGAFNENTNGLFHQYFPKDGELLDVKPEELEYAVNRLNHRARKSLNYRTPHEAYFGTTETLTVVLGS